MTRLLELRQLSVQRGGQAVLDQVSLTLEAGQMGCLMGLSGSGKTTLLRAIAGFIAVSQGQVLFQDQLLSAPHFHRPARLRGIGMVFQEHALLPHLSVGDNMALGLGRLNRSERLQRVQFYAQLLQLEAITQRFPHEISGGQQQRVAIARTLAPEPALVLLDEPFASLDRSLREELLDQLPKLLKKLGTAALWVSHDAAESLAIAERLGVLSEGRLLQWDRPQQLYHRPNSRPVALLTGECSWLKAEIVGDALVSELGRFPAPPGLAHGSTVDMLLRIDDIEHDDTSALKAQIIERQFQGPLYSCTLALPSGQRVSMLMPSHHDHAIGEFIGIRLNLEHVVVFEK